MVGGSEHVVPVPGLWILIWCLYRLIGVIVPHSTCGPDSDYGPSAQAPDHITGNRLPEYATCIYSLTWNLWTAAASTNLLPAHCLCVSPGCCFESVIHSSSGWSVVGLDSDGSKARPWSDHRLVQGPCCICIKGDTHWHNHPSGKSRFCLVRLRRAYYGLMSLLSTAKPELTKPTVLRLSQVDSLDWLREA